MKNNNKSVRQKILRPIGIILGTLFIAAGVFLFVDPIYGTLLEKINAITFIALGLAFIFYGFFKFGSSSS